MEQLGDGFCDLPNEWPVAFIRMWPTREKEMRALSVTPARLARVKQPVLTIHGTGAIGMLRSGAGREWAASLSNARLLTIDGAAHQSWVDAPEIVFPAIDRFLSGEWPPAVVTLRGNPRAREHR